MKTSWLAQLSDPNAVANLLQEIKDRVLPETDSEQELKLLDFITHENVLAAQYAEAVLESWTGLDDSQSELREWAKDALARFKILVPANLLIPR